MLSDYYMGGILDHMGYNTHMMWICAKRYENVMEIIISHLSRGE